MRKNIVAGNWKMNKNLQEGIALAKELNEALSADFSLCFHMASRGGGFSITEAQMPAPHGSSSCGDHLQISLP